MKREPLAQLKAQSPMSFGLSGRKATIAVASNQNSIDLAGGSPVLTRICATVAGAVDGLEAVVGTAMRIHFGMLLAALLAWGLEPPDAFAQRLQFPQAPSGLRSIDPTPGTMPGTFPSGQPIMVPLNGASQQGIYPSTIPGVPTYDPYGSTNTLPTAPLAVPGFVGGSQPLGTQPFPVQPGGAYLGAPNPTGAFGQPTLGAYPYGSPLNSGIQPGIPGSGLSGSIGAYDGGGAVYPPQVYPNSTPPALFPNGFFTGNGGSWLGNLFGGTGNWSGAGVGGGFGGSGGFVGGLPGIGAPNYGSWNPQGSVFSGAFQPPSAIRFFQGPRIRHAWIAGNKDTDAMQINDTDLSLAFAIPNFLFSTQPLYLLPSFSLHNWDGPKVPAGADLPPLAYSAFLDAGWQSDATRILGAELGARVGVFSDFKTANSDSLRLMGRVLGRLRFTPTAMVKFGAIYLDRNKLKLLPAGGVLWQPNPLTRFDLFFPEPKLAHYLATIGNFDTWWYVGGYYGGGAWTVERASGAKDSIDINDIRLLGGLEWGRNEQMRDGRRIGFFEVGYVFKRELLYKGAPADNLDLQDSLILRAGFGY